MKQKLLSLVVLFLGICSAAFADDQTPNALRITLKAAGDEPVEVLFSVAPHLTYSRDGKLLYLTADDRDMTPYEVANIERIQFFHNSGTDAIIKIFEDNATDQNRGIYTLEGVKVERITAPGTYIINGRKVLVK